MTRRVRRIFGRVRWAVAVCWLPWPTSPVTLSSIINISGGVSRFGLMAQDIAAAIAPGFDIFLSAGQSNEFFGSGYNAGLDPTLATTYVMGTGSTQRSLIGPSAAEPYPYPDTTNQSPANTYIGHAGHFINDPTTGYSAAYLKSPRKTLMVCGAFGGTQVRNNGGGQWGVFTAAVGTLASDLVATVNNNALTQTGSNALKGMLWTQGEGDYQAYGNVGQRAVIYSYRACLISTFDYLRANLTGGSQLPTMISRLSQYSIDAAKVNYSYNGLGIDAAIQSMANVLPYLAVVDSQSPTALGSSGIHFTAAEHRTLATRFQTAYATAVAATTTPVTWDALYCPSTAYGCAAGVSFANGNLDVSGTVDAGWKVVLATGPRTAGKLYWEVTAQAVASAANLGYLGLCNTYNDIGNGQYLGAAGLALTSPGSAFFNGEVGKSAGFWQYGTGANKDNAAAGYTLANAADFGGATAAGDVFRFYWDSSTGKVWIGKNGTWSGVPGVSGEWLSGVTGRVFIACAPYTGATNTWRLNAGATAFAYTPPAGSSAWKDGTP